MKEGKCLRLEDIKSPQDIKGLSYAEMNDFAQNWSRLFPSAAGIWRAIWAW